MRLLARTEPLKDRQGRTLSFGITPDNRLVALVPGSAFPVVPVLPPDPEQPLAHAVAASQNQRGDIWLTAAFGSTEDGDSEVYVAGPLGNDSASLVRQISGGPRVQPAWVKRRHNQPVTHVPELQIGTDDDGAGPPLLLATTALGTGRVPRYERMSADPADRAVAVFPPLDDATEVLDVALGAFPQGRGAYALTRIGNRTQLEFVGVPDVDTNVSLQVSLTPPPGALRLSTELNEAGYSALVVRGNGVFRFDPEAQQRAWAQAAQIAEDRLELVRLATRSALTDDYRRGADGRFGPHKVFRTTLSLPGDVCRVHLWADRETEAEVDGQAVRLSPVTPLRLAPSEAARISISLPADGITCPTVAVRTNRMRWQERFYVFPDAELHRSLRELPQGALFGAREQLGAGALSAAQAQGLQNMVQHLTGTLQYTHNRGSEGFHHDRLVRAANLPDSHVSYQPADGRLLPLPSDAARGVLAGAGGPVTLADLKSALGDLESVTLTTLDKIGGDVAQAAQRAWGDVNRAFSSFGDDLVHGEFRAALQDLLQGGENVRRDLFQGAANVFHDVVDGAAQTLVAVVKLAGRTLMFALEHTGKVGEFIEWLLHQLGVGLEKLLHWLAHQIGWDDVVRTHDELCSLVNRGLAGMRQRLGEVRRDGDRLLRQVEANVDSALDRAIQQFGGTKPTQDSPLSSVMREAVEWLLNRVVTAAPQGSHTPVLASASATLEGPLQELMHAAADLVGEEGDRALAALRSAGADFALFLQQPNHPERLLAALLEIAKAVATVGLGALRGLHDTLMRLAETALAALQEVLNQPIELPFISDLYRWALGEDRPLTLMSLGSLLVALPATLVHKALFHRPPFQAGEHLGLDLSPLPALNRAAGSVSAGVQMAQSILNVASGIIALRKELTPDLDFSDNPIPPSEKPSTLDTGPAVISILDWLVGATSHFVSVPGGTTYPNLQSDPLWQYDVISKRPNVLGWDLWIYNSLVQTWGLASLLTSTAMRKSGVKNGRVRQFSDVDCLVKSVLSLGQIVIASMQQDAEYHKRARLMTISTDRWGNIDPAARRTLLLDVVRADLSPDELELRKTQVDAMTAEQLESQVATLRNYLEWAAQSTGISDKGFALFMGILPGTARFTFMPKLVEASDGISLIVGVVLVPFCRLSGGITQAVRTGREALL
jgi:hypothetical protein